MKTTIQINNVHCNGCKNLIERSCLALDGLTTCNVDVATGKTELEHDDSFNLKLLIKTIEPLAGGKYQVVL